MQRRIIEAREARKGEHVFLHIGPPMVFEVQHNARLLADGRVRVDLSGIDGDVTAILAARQPLVLG